MRDIAKAIISLYPNATWSLDGDEYEGLSWLDVNQSKPTKQELIDECARLQAEYDAKEYQRLRADEYPSFADQFDLLYHGGYDAWKAAIDEVKNKHPKG
jgi:hypothetical protein